MAKRQLEVVVVIKDQASQGLNNVKRKTKEAGDAAKQANLDFTSFNKTLFATGAFIGTFVKGISSIKSALDTGAELDRLSTQFERTLGPKGRLFTAINSLTTTGIDKMEAMRGALDLAQLGIVRDSDQAASLIAKAGTAAKLAGRNAGEGIQAFVNFYKTGEVSQLEFLNLISRTNPALQAQLAVLNKAGGVMGTVISTQAKLALGQALLNKATRGNLNTQRDLADVMADLNSSFAMVRGEFGKFLGAALAPIVEKFTVLLDKLSENLENIRKNHKDIVFLTKAFIVATGAVVGLAGALGTLALTVRLLGFAGIGIPSLILSIITLGGLFLGVTSRADTLIKKLEVFGAFIKGIWELVKNLDEKSGFSKMNKATYELLKKNGLLGIVDVISRIISITRIAVRDMVSGFKMAAKKIDDVFGGLFRTFFDSIDGIKKPWSKWWISDAISPIEKFSRAAMVIFGGLGAFLLGKSLFGGLSSILSKIPGIGKFFGGGGKDGKGPKGTKNDPIYVSQAEGGFGSKLGQGMLEGLLGKGMGSILDRIIAKGGFLGTLANLPRLLTSNMGAIFNTLKGVFAEGAGILAQRLLGAAPMMGQALGVVGAGVLGYALGTVLEGYLDKIKGKTDEGFEYSGLGGIFFKLDKLFGGEASTKFMQAEDQFKRAGSKEEMDKFKFKRHQMSKSNTVVPKPGQSLDQEMAIDNVGEQLKNLNISDREKMQKAVESAMSVSSEGGSILTAEEMQKIMNNAESTGYLKIISENTKPENKTINPMSRRP